MVGSHYRLRPSSHALMNARNLMCRLAPAQLYNTYQDEMIPGTTLTYCPGKGPTNTVR